MCNFVVVSIETVDGIAPLYSRSSVGTVMTNVMFRINMALVLVWLSLVVLTLCIYDICRLLIQAKQGSSSGPIKFDCIYFIHKDIAFVIDEQLHARTASSSDRINNGFILLETYLQCICYTHVYGDVWLTRFGLARGITHAHLISSGFPFMRPGCPFC